MSIESQEQYESPWHRVHPISPFVRGWVVVVGAIYIYSQNILSSALEGNLKGNVFELPSEVLWPIMGIAFGIIALLLVGFYLSWRFTQYQITDDHVRTRSGILFRQHRQARIDRVQAIDIVQPLLARIFGLAELKFEVADSGQSAMNLSYLKYSDAQTLRNTILARAAGLRTTAPHPSGTDDAQETQAASSSSKTATAPTNVSGAWAALAQCESGGNWATNTGNGYYGGLQFSLSSWRAVGGTQYAAYPHQASASQQIAAAEKLRASGGWGHWPACSSKLGLR